MAVNKVRGAILSRFKTESDFARALGWTRQRVNAFSLGIREPRLHDVQEMAAVLNMDASELSAFFLDLLSQKRDENKN